MNIQLLLIYHINRRLDFEEQEEIDLINKQELQIENIKKETFKHLEESQPKRLHIGVDTKALTRNYSDRVYETACTSQRRYFKRAPKT